MRTSASVGFACLLAIAGCGGSSDDGSGAATTGGTGAVMAVTGGTGGTGGTAGMTMVPPPMMPTMPMVPTMPMDMMTTNPAGVGEENTPCMPTMSNCNMGLACATLPDPFNGVCGRTCAMDGDCTMPDEVCDAYSSMDTQGICINLVPAWELFLFSETSACQDGATPVGISGQMNLPGGICLELCQLEGSDPMNLPPDLPPEQIVTCAMGQECLNVLTSDMSGMMEQALGACGVGVARGGVCDVNMGQVCSDVADICAPSDPNRLDGEQKCFQDCSDPMVTCEGGTTCTPLEVMGTQVAAYCL